MEKEREIWERQKKRYPKNIIFINNGKKVVTFGQDAETVSNEPGTSMFEFPKNACRATDAFIAKLKGKIFLAKCSVV